MCIGPFIKLHQLVSWGKIVLLHADLASSCMNNCHYLFQSVPKTYLFARLSMRHRTCNHPELTGATKYVLRLTNWVAKRNCLRFSAINGMYHTDWIADNFWECLRWPLFLGKVSTSSVFELYLSLYHHDNCTMLMESQFFMISFLLISYLSKLINWIAVMSFIGKWRLEFLRLNNFYIYVKIKIKSLYPDFDRNGKINCPTE